MKGKKTKIVVPKTVQDTIPFQAILSNSILELGNGYYSQVIALGNINYTLARQEDRETIYNRYGEFLNSLPNDVSIQVFINNVKLNRKDFMEAVTVEEAHNFPELTKEYNQILIQKIEECHNKTAEKEVYIVFKVHAQNPQHAAEQLSTHLNNAETAFITMGSNFTVLPAEEVLKIFYNFYNPLNRNKKDFFLYKDLWKMGFDVKDIISPNSFKFKINHYTMGEIMGRTMFIKGLPSTLKDTLISDILDCSFTMSISMHIEPTDPSQAVTNIRRRITGMEANKIQYTKRAGLNLNPYIPYELKTTLSEANELLDSIQNKNKKMFYVGVYINILGTDIESLDERTSKIQSICRKHLVTCTTMTYQQEDGLASVLPVGRDKVDIKRALLTDSTSVFMPFSSQEIVQEGGFYYGINKVSKSMIILNRKTMENPAGFYLGKPRSGKSFKSKFEIVNILLRTEDDIIVIDPENEFTKLCENFNGEVIRLAPNSSNYLNAMDITEDYGLDEVDPVSAKSEFILSLFETIKGTISANQKTIIDRCVIAVYSQYVSSGYKQSKIPDLNDFYDVLCRQEGETAKDLAEALELYTKGSLNIFAHKSNVELSNRFTVFNVTDLKKNLRTIGMLITCDFIWNRLCKNYEEGKNTWVFVDEFQSFYGEDCDSISEFFNEFFRRSQKKGGIPTGITQNIKVVTSHKHAKTMLSNSELLMLFKQSDTDREELANLIRITPQQMSHIKDPKQGEGLMFFKGKAIPFIDRVPKETQLYKMMTTQFTDKQEEIEEEQKEEKEVQNNEK
jgi:type IV secretory pathway VirB4 component